MTTGGKSKNSLTSVCAHVFLHIQEFILSLFFPKRFTAILDTRPNKEIYDQEDTIKYPIPISKVLSYHNPVLDLFKKHNKAFIVCNINDSSDLKPISRLIDKNRDIKFIIIPDTISSNILNNILIGLDGNSILYSECDDKTSFDRIQTIIIDYFGALPFIFKYGNWAYWGNKADIKSTIILYPLLLGIPIFIKGAATSNMHIKQLINNNICFKTINFQGLESELRK